jgi:thiol-disulfide isomerase/thioredoxin
MNYFSSFQKISLFLIIGISIGIMPVSATIFAEDGSELTVGDLYDMVNMTRPANNTTPVTFFFDPECGPCIPVHAYLENYLTNHPDVNVTMVNLSSGPESESMMRDLFIQHNRTMMNTPVIFFGPMGLEGTDEIISHFELLYHWYTDESCNCQPIGMPGSAVPT